MADSAELDLPDAVMGLVLVFDGLPMAIFHGAVFAGVGFGNAGTAVLQPSGALFHHGVERNAIAGKPGLTRLDTVHGNEHPAA